jgi:hypothetical protein
MSSLLERAEGALALAAAATTAVKAETAARALDEVAGQLRVLRTRLGAANQKRSTLEARAFGVGAWPDSSKARASLAAYQAAVEVDPAAGRAEQRSATSAVTKFVEKAEERIAEAIDRCRDSLRDELKSVDDLADVEGFRDQVAQIKSEGERLVDEKQRWKAADAASLDQILIRRATLEGRLEPLIRNDVPVAVKRFFREARKTGARFDLLTDEVMVWLRARGYENRLLVIIK